MTVTNNFGTENTEYIFGGALHQLPARSELLLFDDKLYSEDELERHRNSYLDLFEYMNIVLYVRR